MDRSSSLLWAVVVHLLIGLSGAAAGVPLVAGVLSGSLDPFEPTQRDIAVASAIAFGVLGYGVLEVAGAIGLWRGWHPGWWLALVVDVVGLAVLAWAVWISGSDGILIGGAVLWLVAIGLLLAPATRAALRR